MRAVLGGPHSHHRETTDREKCGQLTSAIYSRRVGNNFRPLLGRTSPSTFAEYSAAFGHASVAVKGGGTPPAGEGTMAEQLKAGADAQIITDEQLRKAE